MLNASRCFSGIIVTDSPPDVVKGPDVAKVVWSYFLCVCLKIVDVGENGCDIWLYTVAYFFSIRDYTWSINKMKNNKFRTVRTFLKCYTKFVETGTHRHDRSFSWLCTSLASGRVKLFYLAKSAFLVQWNRHASVVPHKNTTSLLTSKMANSVVIKYAYYA